MLEADTHPTPNYRSLVPGGFFSSAPFDEARPRSERTNNPGALNIAAWQRRFPGLVGETPPDAGGNVTGIWVTPEHGIAAWHHLLTDRYGLGPRGRITLAALACRYAGVADPAASAPRGYVRGWARFAPDLQAGTVIALDDDDELCRLARGMFGHELGRPSPIGEAQVRMALALHRAGTLPAD